ncbi:carboxypeptidase-like regulatory domain-containing protein [Aeoliella sp.]|uniref:carboxypeptidase-like regulatory domain-containing protein n=1 Tax=Aeoliella sp. TaxID=2795800 RepID=UPI003CCBB35B
MSNHHFVASLLALLLLCAVGCGDPVGNVSGTLTTADGKPLVGARVVLSSLDSDDAKQSARAITDDRGFFDIGRQEKGDGAPPGNYAVAIVENRGSLDSVKPRTIAAKYQRPATSELKVEVVNGSRTKLDLTLESP